MGSKFIHQSLRYWMITFILISSQQFQLMAVIPEGSETQLSDTIALKHGAKHIGPRSDADMQSWRDLAFGQFIHWGVYSIPGGMWDGKVYPGASEWIRAWKEMPKAAYDSLYRSFNPTDFNAAKWASMAREMGAKYLILTTKHHDGFCLWPSEYTDYSIANTPFKRDIVGELVKAYNEAGIEVVLYFSIIDWNHPGYRTNLKNASDSLAYETFKLFTANQLKELLTRYPGVKGFWFDGTWDAAWKQQAAFADELEQELRKVKPGLVIGSRFRPDDYGKRGSDSNGRLIGDYEQGWERDLPDSYEQLKGNDWECVMTIPENQWGYHSKWLGYVKNTDDLIEMLTKTISMNGNFVLNFGPDSKGNFRAEEIDRASEIGKWLKYNGKAIYSCRNSELKKQDWGYFTENKTSTFMVVFNRPVDNRLDFIVPAKSRIPDSVRMLSDGSLFKVKAAGRNKKGDDMYFVELPSSLKLSQAIVLELKMSL